METIITPAVHVKPGITINKMLLFFGLLSSVYYAAINLIVPFYYEGYSHITYTISELSAIGAPTRALWVFIVPFYILFYAMFGWGVLRVAADNKLLKIAGILIIIYCVINLYWPPMHMRGSETSLTDTLHIVWSAIASLLMMTIMGISAVALDKKFKYYSVITILLLIVFGLFTGLEAPNIPTDGPTPFIGLWERIMIGLFLLWVGVFSVKLLQREKQI